MSEHLDAGEAARGSARDVEQPDAADVTTPGADAGDAGRDEPGKNQAGLDQPGDSQPGKNRPGESQAGRDEPGSGRSGTGRGGGTEPGAASGGGAGSDVGSRGRVVLTKPSTGQLLVRGATRRCPWCGDRKAYFTSWFGRSDSCRKCDRGYRRGDDAFELGAVTVNIIFTFLSILLALVVVFVLIFGLHIKLSLVWITIIGAFFVLLAPLIYYPLSFTVWQAIDLIMRAPTDAELSGGPDAKL